MTWYVFFALLALVGAYHFLCLARWLRRVESPTLVLESTNISLEPGQPHRWPPITVIRPVKGLDPGSAASFRALLEQSYPHMEVIFSLQDPHDPALPVIENLAREYPSIPIRILVNPVLPGFNGKASNLVHGARASRRDILVVVDSDVLPEDDLLLQRLVRGLEGEGPAGTRSNDEASSPRIGGNRPVGATCALCFYREATNFWGRLLQVETNVMMTQVGMLNGAWGDVQAGVGGAVFAIRREALERVGGFEAFGDSIAEDITLGQALVREGYRIRWVARASCLVNSLTPRQLIDNLKRWSLADFTLSKPYWAVHFAVNRLYVYGLIASLFWPQLLLPSLGYMGMKIAFTYLSERFMIRSQVSPWTFLIVIVDCILAFGFPIFLLTPTFRWRGLPYRVDRSGRLWPLSDGK